MLNKLNLNNIQSAVVALFFAVAFKGYSANQELPKFIPDDNAIDLPAHIVADFRAPH
jgi:hypothetical protein